MSPQTLSVTVAIIGLILTVSIPIVGYVLRAQNERILTVEANTRDMHLSAKQYTQEAEVRLREEIARNEDRAEKGDERVLAHVDSQFNEVNRQLREIRGLLQQERKA